MSYDKGQPYRIRLQTPPSIESPGGHAAEDCELLTGTRITRPERTVVLGNGIGVTRFDPARFSDADRLAMRAELELNLNGPVVGIVARLVAANGIHEFISAQRILGISHQIIVVGAREPEKSDAISEREIEEAERTGVRFLGTRPDVDLILAVCDVFALPSYREGVPRAAIEAAASGVPTAAFDVRGCRRVIDDDRPGRPANMTPPTGTKELPTKHPDGATDTTRRPDDDRVGGSVTFAGKRCPARGQRVGSDGEIGRRKRDLLTTDGGIERHRRGGSWAGRL